MLIIKRRLPRTRKMHFDCLESRDLLAAIPIFSTGVGAGGTLLAVDSEDPHFQLISAPVGDTASAAFVFGGLPEGYVANTSTSQWIGPSSNAFGDGSSGDFTYRQSFDLTGLDPSTAVLQMELASDNDSRIVLNGMDTGIAVSEPEVVSPDDFDTFHLFTLNKDFIPGVNTLDVVVHNDYSATGVQLNLTGTADLENPPPPAAPVPTLTSAIEGPNSTAVEGTLSGAPNTQYTINFSQTSGGATIGSATVTSDSTGHATIATNLPVALQPGQSIYATSIGPDTSASASSAPEIVTAIADLSVTPLARAGSAVAGSDYTLSFLLSNNGPSPAANVAFNEVLPLGVPVESVSSTTGTATVSQGVLQLDLPSFVADGSVTVSVTLQPPSAAPLVTSASVSSGTLDPNPANNTNAISIPVTTGVSQVTLTASPTVATPNAPITLTANVASGIASSAIPTGNVTFLVDGAAVSTAVITPSNGSGAATFTISAPVAAGMHTITANYGGDERFQTSSASTTIQVIQPVIAITPATTVTQVTTSPNPSASGQPVTITASVSAVGIPTGTVTFFDGTTQIGQEPLGANGQARFTYNSLTVGTHNIVAAYAGNPNFQPSSSGTVTQVVGSIPTVVSVQRFNTRAQASTLVLTFSTPLDPARALNSFNYEIMGPGSRPISISAASISANGLTVTLRAARPLNIQQTYTLIVVGSLPRGLTSNLGVALDGGSTGVLGSDFVTKITKHTLILREEKVRRR